MTSVFDESHSPLRHLAPRVFYSQFAEDLVLERVFPQSSGLYIDAGANDPVLHSVTKRFHDRGWRGVNIEPNPLLFDRLARLRPSDINLNCGVAAREGTLTFFEFPTVDGWSTFVPELADHYRREGLVPLERQVPVRRLDSICADFVGDRAIDFLKVDVEGFEAQLLYGGDWRRWRPRVVLIEATWFEGWEPFLLDAGYLFATTDGINRYYVRAEDEPLIQKLGTPPDVSDFAIPYAVYRELVEIEAETPLKRAQRLAHWRLKRWIQRHPRLKATAKRILKRGA
jgi:FkbM family methyltransferase